MIRAGWPLPKIKIPTGWNLPKKKSAFFYMDGNNIDCNQIDTNKNGFNMVKKGFNMVLTGFIAFGRVKNQWF